MEGSSTGTPGWVKLLGVVAIVLILVFVVLALAGLGGGHGPGRHTGLGVFTPAASTHR